MNKQHEEVKTNELIHLMQKYGSIPAIGTSSFILRNLAELPTWKEQVEEEREQWRRRCQLSGCNTRAEIEEMQRVTDQSIGQRVGRRLNLLAKKGIVTVITELRPRSIWARTQREPVPIRYVLSRGHTRGMIQ